MSRSSCNKKSASLLWTLLECVFFSGVVLGWTWLALIFRNDHYLLSGCNITIHDVTLAYPTPTSTTQVYRRLERRPCRKKPTSLPVDSPDDGRARIARSVITALTVTQAGIDTPSTLSLPVNHTVAPPSLRPKVSNSTPVKAVGGDKDKGAGTEVEVCPEQREMLRLLFAVVAVLRDLFVLPIGAFLDKYGTTRTRLLTVLIFAVGTLMMTFITEDVPMLMIPALTLTGVAGVAVLLTNVQIANMFGRRRHLVVSLYCGASLSSGLITYTMQLSHNQGVDVQTSFMFLTIGLVPMLVSTVAFLPKTRVPWPLPDNYGRRRNQSLDENLLQAGVAKLRRPIPRFWPKGGQLFVGAMLWYGVQSLHTAQAETLLVDFGHWKDASGSDLEQVFGWLQLLSIPAAIVPGMIIDRRRRRELGMETGTQQMQSLVPAILLTTAVAIGERTLLMVGARGVVTCLVLAFLLHVLHRVCLLATTLCFLLHLHFVQDHTGKYVGVTLTVSAIICAFQFPLRLYLQHQPFVAHSLMLTLLFLTFAHAFNVWNCCRRRLIRDHPERSLDNLFRSSGQALLTVHIHTDDSNLRPEGREAGHNTSQQVQGACPGTSGCCPGPSGHSGSRSSASQTGGPQEGDGGGSATQDGGEGSCSDHEEERGEEERPQGEKRQAREGRDDEKMAEGRSLEMADGRDLEVNGRGLVMTDGRDSEMTDGHGLEMTNGRSHDIADGRGQSLKEGRDLTKQQGNGNIEQQSTKGQSRQEEGNLQHQGKGKRRDQERPENMGQERSEEQGPEMPVETKSKGRSQERPEGRSQERSEGQSQERPEGRSQERSEGRSRDKHRNGGLHVVIKEPDFIFGMDT